MLGYGQTRLAKTHIFLVHRGVSVVQNLDPDLGEVIYQGTSTIGQTRKLTCKCFVFFLSNC